MNASIDILTIVVDNNLLVKRFSGNITGLFNLNPSDVGHSIRDINHQPDYDNFTGEIERALINDEIITKVIKRNDHWYNVCHIPVKKDNGDIDGVLIAIIDIPQSDQDTTAHKFHNQIQEHLVEMGIYALKKNDFPSVSSHITTIVHTLLNADYTILLEYEQESNTMLLKSAEGFPDSMIDSYRVEMGHGWGVDVAYNTPDVLILNDFMNEKNFTVSPLLRDKNIASCLSALIDGPDIPYGVIAVFTQLPHTFTEFETNFLRMAANILANVVDRNRYEDQIRETNQILKTKLEEQNRLQKEILDISERERWEIAQYLHDDLGQTMIVTKMMIRNFFDHLDHNDAANNSDMETIKELIDDLSASIRELSHRITPLEIKSADVDIAFKKLALNTSKIYGILCTVEIDLVVLSINDHNVTTNLYYIAQEAIKNAVQHGHADKVHVQLALKKNKIVLSIDDNGSGYSIKRNRKKPHGMGINIMRYRTELMNGKFEIKGKKKETGTVVICKVPDPT